MCPANRNRPDYRSIAFCIVIALIALSVFALPASANTAEYFVSEDGKSLTAHITMVNQTSFYLVKPGFLGTEEVLKADEISLKDMNGNDVDYKQSDYTLKFEKGDYTLVYKAKLTDKLVYAKYPETYNVTVFIPKPYSTGHLVLGPVSKGGVVTDVDTGLVVSYLNAKAISVTFYESNRPLILYGFLGIWAVVMLVLLVRHNIIKKRMKKINE